MTRHKQTKTELAQKRTEYARIYRQRKKLGIVVQPKSKFVSQPKEKKAKNYLNNADLLAEVKLSKKQGKMTEKMGRMLIILVDRYASKSNWANYTYNEDMRGLALLQLVRGWAGFNADKYTNAFAYYTQSIKNSFIQMLNSEKKERMKRDLLLIDGGYNPSHGFVVENSNMTPSDERVYVQENVTEVDEKTKHLL